MRVEIPDFDKVTTGFDPLPEERLTFQITKGTLGTSKTGNPKVDLELTCQSPGYEGRILFDTQSLLPNAQFAIKVLLNASAAPQDAGGFDTEEVVGCSVDAQLTIRSYCKACDDKLDGNVEECPTCKMETRRSNDVAGYFPSSN